MWLFSVSKIQKWLGRGELSSDAEVINTVNDHFSTLDESYTKGMRGLEKRWTKCIELKGDYVKKYILFR